MVFSVSSWRAINLNSAFIFTLSPVIIMFYNKRVFLKFDRHSSKVYPDCGNNWGTIEAGCDEDRPEFA